MALPEQAFLEPVQGRVEALPGLGIADPDLFRKRVRLNRALPKASLASPAEEVLELERVIGDDDLLPFYVLELGAKLGGAVCKVAFDDEEDGTGFLIGPDILITNNHVIYTSERARQARCIFDYQLNTDRRPRETVMFKLDPDSLFLSSDAQTGLDYTFVRIDPAASARFGVVPVSRGSFTNLEKEFAHIVQHPNGKMKRVAQGIGEPFDFNLVPVHLKAMAERALRRGMASKILAAAIAKTTESQGEADWLVGGDFNAELATGDFTELVKSMTPVSAADEGEGAMSYLKSPKSLIDHIFISPNMAQTYGAKDFFIVAADSKTPDYVKKISDHRPVLMRLSLRSGKKTTGQQGVLPAGLAEALNLG